MSKQNKYNNKITKEEYDALPDYEQRLVDSRLPTIKDTKEYMRTVKWVPYNEYLENIFHRSPGREFDEFNMKTNFFEARVEPDKLIREAAYKLSLKVRPCHGCEAEYTEEEQLELEEMLYKAFKRTVREWDVEE